jgi:PAS domain S-box-containing protein
MSESALYRVIVDSLSAHVAVLDRDGVIIETNRAWRDFAQENGMSTAPHCRGVNYLAICDADQDHELSGYIARAIRRVISGEIKEFLTQYPCHSPTEQRWFSMRVVPFRGQDRLQRVIITHEDITPIMLVQERLRHKEEQLRQRSAKLEETNIALEVLLERRAKDRQDLEERMVANIRELVQPYLERLQACALPSREKTLIDIALTHLEDITAPFLQRLSSLHLTLTPQEVEVATLVRQGKSSKEIAEALGISVAAISFHRKNLRAKLGLTKTGANLRTHLLSLQ